jgi:AtzH-like
VMFEIDIPEVLRDLVATFETYERALITNDIETVNKLFWDSPSTIRYGTREHERHYGYSEITTFRSRRGPVNQQSSEKSEDHNIRTRFRNSKYRISFSWVRQDRPAKSNLDPHGQRLEDRRRARVVRATTGRHKRPEVRYRTASITEER